MNNEIIRNDETNLPAVSDVNVPEVDSIPEIGDMPQIADMPVLSTNEETVIEETVSEVPAVPSAENAAKEELCAVSEETVIAEPQFDPFAASIAAADNSLVVCSGLCKKYGSVFALNGVNLVLPAGKIIGLLGPNGAGKTTLIKILNGLLRPDSGVISIDGNVPGVESKKVVSYLPDRMYFADWMKVGDMLDMFSDFYADFNMDKANEMCRILGLDRKMRIKSLSKGTREKMQLMLVMSRKAKLYLMDEPIAGVDPAAREFILHTILSNYNEGGTVLLSTHLISDVEQVLDEAVFLSYGRVILHDSVDNIRERESKTVDGLFREMFRADFYNRGGVL